MCFAILEIRYGSKGMSGLNHCYFKKNIRKRKLYMFRKKEIKIFLAINDVHTITRDYNKYGQH